MWPSSWTATAAGPRGAACPASRGTGAGSRRSAGPCAPRANSASAISPSTASRPRTGAARPRRSPTSWGSSSASSATTSRICTPTTCACGSSASGRGCSPDIRGLLEEAEDLTRPTTGLTLVVAFNYGGRQEIVRAVRILAEQVKAGPSTRPRSTWSPRRRPSTPAASRSGSRHPHLGRAAGLELPDLADRLFRIRLPARFLAGFRPRHLQGGHRRVCPARPPLRRPERPGGLTWGGRGPPRRPAKRGPHGTGARVASAVVARPSRPRGGLLGRLAVRPVLARWPASRSWPNGRP
jgi:hypothetical protein